MNRVTRAVMALTVCFGVPLFAPGLANAACVTPATKIIFAPQGCQAPFTVEAAPSPAVAEEEQRKSEKVAAEEKAPVQHEAAPAPRMSTMHPMGRGR